jgi:hypothetical protein
MKKVQFVVPYAEYKCRYSLLFTNMLIFGGSGTQI